MTIDFIIKAAISVICGGAVIYASFAVTKFSVKELERRVTMLEASDKSNAQKIARLEEAISTLKQVPEAVAKVNENTNKILIMLAERR